ncbi:uncharacterized protein N7483_007991 [Penicillium malachiteum]|uniref:uncharacterized protein n=1 Tax=Penicillium malachiteum TaxID=1324776 RepID=UPI0025487969|nr:uncharacterized protein N7483_007991 [Penicillium malachiteum]KAJ5726634.1 hypothetical protein N7483_007991 [Penicillium malachiteum]
MKFQVVSIIISRLLLVDSVIAFPMTAQRQIRHKSRQLSRSVNRESYLPQITSLSGDIIPDHNSGNIYSSNWAGAVLIGTSFTSVTAHFIFPTPKIPPEGSTSQQYCACAWIGIDGHTCHTAILQTGVSFCISGTSISYQAWYEWFPEPGGFFDNITIASGDKIRVTDNASSQTSGTATVENLTNGDIVTRVFNGAMSGTLCEYNAEWIVEDFSESGNQVPFADFGAITFSNAIATGGGLVLGPSTATLMDLIQDNTVLTSTSLTSTSVTLDSITVRYI